MSQIEMTSEVKDEGEDLQLKRAMTRSKDAKSQIVPYQREPLRVC